MEQDFDANPAFVSSATPPPSSPTVSTEGFNRGERGGGHRGWTISYDPPPIPCRDFDWSATGPNFDASYEGAEDGFVGNGQQVFARTLGALKDAVDVWFDEQVPA